MAGEEKPRYQAVLDGETELTFGLLGERLGHSHSPAIHGLLGSTPYEAVEVPRDRVGEFLAARRFTGLNVTIPYKKVAAAACDALSPAAARLGNANTLVLQEDGLLYGDNTDYHGFSRQLASTGVSPQGRVCLVLGDGGAAATVRAVLEDGGAAEVLTATRRPGEGRLVLAALNGDEFLPDGTPMDPADAAAAAAARGRIEIVVNATPAGMYPHADDPAPIDLLPPAASGLRLRPGLQPALDPPRPAGPAARRAGGRRPAHARGPGQAFQRPLFGRRPARRR